MTHEESKIMWKLEKDSISKHLLSKEMKRLYDKVDELITTDKLTYQQFTEDMIDATTDIIVKAEDSKTKEDRVGSINRVCNHLYEKYIEQYNNTESNIGDREILVDNIEIQNTEGICTSASISATR